MKTKTKQLVSPFGRAGFCRLIRPNFKFQPEAGEFNARLILSPEDAGPFIEQLDALYEAAYQKNLAEIQAKKPGVREIKRADKPYKQLEDPDTGEKLPDFQFNFRLKFKRIGKNEQGVKEVYGTQRPIVVDSKGQPVREEIGSGSTIRVSFIPNPFYTAALGSGLSMRLVGVQVKELVQIGLEKPEFGEVDGYEAPQGTASDPIETMHAGADAPIVTDNDDGGEEWS